QNQLSKTPYIPIFSKNMATLPKKAMSFDITRYPAPTTAITDSRGDEEIGSSLSTDQIASRIAVAIIIGSADERTTNARVEEGNWARGTNISHPPRSRR